MKTFNVSTDSSGNVTISDNGNASVNKKSKVKWNVTGDLDSIVIRPFIQEGQIDIWEEAPAPHPHESSKNWRGTVGDSAGDEYYYVDWVKKDGTSGIIDPIITVNR